MVPPGLAVHIGGEVAAPFHTDLDFQPSTIAWEVAPDYGLF